MAESLTESRDGCRIALRGLRNRLLPASGFPHLTSAAGFTLIELIVVLVIVAVSIAVVVPRVGSNWQKIEDSAFLQEFTETIKRTRLFAMNCGHPVAFRLNGITRVYGFEGPPGRPIPLNAEVRSDNLQKDRETGDFLIVFHPDGSLVGNDLEVIFDQERTYHISIHPLFGTASLQRVTR
ncbi:MAG: prepilin-type N-terminal cleavage/methylation domain-containing protein [Syntrophobacteraceae bacterium]